jgi:tRNA threonylcarbamoyladenosine biosynthesis protein TsaB
MMWVLAVDTSSPGGAVALLRDSDVVVERRGDPDHSHAEHLPAMLVAVLADAGILPAALDLFAVATGPGSFTGVRVGLATVQGLALALDRPTVGVPSLAASAWRYFQDAPHPPRCGVWRDGARGDVFAAAFGRPALRAWPLDDLTAITVAPPDAVAAAWHSLLAPDAPVLLGPGAPGRAAAEATGRLVIAADDPLAVPIGRIGWLVHQAGGSGAPHALAPLYVRRPDAEVERDRRLGRGPLS